MQPTAPCFLCFPKCLVLISGCSADVAHSRQFADVPLPVFVGGVMAKDGGRMYHSVPMGKFDAAYGIRTSFGRRMEFDAAGPRPRPTGDLVLRMEFVREGQDPPLRGFGAEVKSL